MNRSFCIPGTCRCTSSVCLCLLYSMFWLSFHWGGGVVYILICFLFVCVLALLCSWANKTPFWLGHWYGPIKGCYQPERFNDGWDVRVDRLAGREKETARCEVPSVTYQCCGSVAPLQATDITKLFFSRFYLEETDQVALATAWISLWLHRDTV